MEALATPVEEKSFPTDIVVLTHRVKNLRERLRASKSNVCVERSRLYTQSWKETEGEPLDLRWAMMFEKFLNERTVSIREEELIVGSQSKYVIGAAPFLEYNAKGPAEVLKAERFVMRGETESTEITEEEYYSLLEDIEYWTGKSVRERFSIRAQEIFGKKSEDIQKARVIVIVDTKPVLSGILDWMKVLKKGLRGIITEAEAELDRLTFTNIDDLKKYNFLRAIIITLRAVINFAHRHASLARELAKGERDTIRKRELEGIAEVCDKVPEHPADSFHEAIQSLWTTYLCAFLESSCTQGRWDQYLYPFYKRDLEKGKLTQSQGAELLACLWIKFNELTAFQTPVTKEVTQGQLFQYVTIAGLTPDGKDATNELSYLILEVARQLKLAQPAIALSYHNHISDEFLIKAVEANRDIGGGIPAFLNVGECANRLIPYGFAPEDARDVYFYNCVHPVVSDKSLMFGSGSINMPKIFELTLNNGVDPKTGKQLGPVTGDPRRFKSFEELFNAFKAQYIYWIDLAAKVLNVYVLIKMENCRLPFRSALMNDCIKQGRDVFSGGLKYSQYDILYNLKCGQNIANSMVAIKKLVFEQKKISMEELLEALHTNFEGREDLRQQLMAQPKWGNDDDEVDNLYAQFWDFTGEIPKSSNIILRTYQNVPAIVKRGGATWHYVSGKSCGAFPDGRKAGQPMADGNVSPAAGTDHKGPTAVINSASKLSREASVSDLFNMKFPPYLLKTDEGKHKLLALIKTYFNRGGYHIQFNMISKETLLDAKAHPENYRDLVVRIAGFSAYFVDLVPAVQDDIIARTEQGF